MARMSSALLLLILCSSLFAGASKRRIHVTDDLQDVVDDEEDDAWKEWGTTTRKNPSEDDEFDPPPDFSGMYLGRIQDEMMRRHTGPTFGFVKLRLGRRRTRDEVTGIAMKWTKVLKTGAVEATFMAVDLSTIMFTMNKGQDTLELKEFLLDQQEAYEVKIGDRVFRRLGDPPLEEIMEQLRREKGGTTQDGEEEETKEEL